MKILVVGMGLIGGSFCKAIKKYTAHHMIGMDSDEATLEMAIAMESVDEIIPVDRPHLMKRADLTIVALPPHKIVDFILENKNNFAQGAIVTQLYTKGATSLTNAVMAVIASVLLARALRPALRRAGILPLQGGRAAKG